MKTSYIVNIFVISSVLSISFMIFNNPFSLFANQSTVYYVAPDGDDGNSGTTLADPWQTIQKAANTLNAGGKGWHL